MSSNFLPPQNEPYNYQGQPRRRNNASDNGRAVQQPASQPYQMPPAGNIPASFSPQGQLPPPQPAQQWYNPPFMAHPMQTMRRWSNKMAAMRQSGSPAEPHPLVRYRAPQPFPMNERPIQATPPLAEP